MSLPIGVRPEAAADLRAARRWYEGQTQGLGAEFVREVSEAFDRISGLPEAFAVVWRDVRKHRARRFPYAVFYRVPADRVEVLAIHHASRDPSAWRSRADP